MILLLIMITTTTSMKMMIKSFPFSLVSWSVGIMIASWVVRLLIPAAPMLTHLKSLSTCHPTVPLPASSAPPTPPPTMGTAPATPTSVMPTTTVSHAAAASQKAAVFSLINPSQRSGWPTSAPPEYHMARVKVKVKCMTLQVNCRDMTLKVRDMTQWRGRQLRTPPLRKDQCLLICQLIGQICK